MSILAIAQVALTFSGINTFSDFMPAAPMHGEKQCWSDPQFSAGLGAEPIWEANKWNTEFEHYLGTLPAVHVRENAVFYRDSVTLKFKHESESPFENQCPCSDQNMTTGFIVSKETVGSDSDSFYMSVEAELPFEKGLESFIFLQGDESEVALMVSGTGDNASIQASFTCFSNPDDVENQTFGEELFQNLNASTLRSDARNEYGILVDRNQGITFYFNGKAGPTFDWTSLTSTCMKEKMNAFVAIETNSNDVTEKDQEARVYKIKVHHAQTCLNATPTDVPSTTPTEVPTTTPSDSTVATPSPTKPTDGKCKDDYDDGTATKPWSDFISCTAEAAYCQSQPETLLVHCAKTCGTCTPTPVGCPGGEVDSDYSEGAKNCAWVAKKSKNRCKSKSKTSKKWSKHCPVTCDSCPAV
jgi:hypothetical protein